MLLNDEMTNEEKACQLRERAAIERAEAAELESERNMSANQTLAAQQARQLARHYDRAADRLDPEQGSGTP